MKSAFGIIRNIFSISLTEDSIRYRIIILGIKISFARPVCIIRKLNNPFYKYKKANKDITQLPKATGQLRSIQLANLAIFKEIDYVCRLLNIGYWFDYGSLLGIVRHKGFIPWDDDIDVSMLRKDFELFVNNFEQNSRDKNLYLKHYFNKKGSYLLKVCHKCSKALFVDIFVYDYAPKNMSEEQKLDYTLSLQKLRTEYIKTINYENGDDLYNKYGYLRQEIQDKLKNDSNKNYDLVYGIEFGHEPYIRNNWVMPFEDIFPLKEYIFENIKVFSVNKPEAHLQEVFNNYMKYPNKIDFGHGAYIKLSQKDKETIKELADSIGVHE